MSSWRTPTRALPDSRPSFSTSTGSARPASTPSARRRDLQAHALRALRKQGWPHRRGVRRGRHPGLRANHRDGGAAELNPSRPARAGLRRPGGGGSITGVPRVSVRECLIGAHRPGPPGARGDPRHKHRLRRWMRDRAREAGAAQPRPARASADDHRRRRAGPVGHRAHAKTRARRAQIANALIAAAIPDAAWVVEGRAAQPRDAGGDQRDRRQRPSRRCRTRRRWHALTRAAVPRGAGPTSSP